MLDSLFSAGTLWSFLCVLARVSGMFVFAPFPGALGAAEIPKVAASLAITILLFPAWPRAVLTEPHVSQMTAIVLCELALGTGMGLVVAFFSETFVMAAQIVSLQAGYSFASTIDPLNHTDSGLLQSAAQLAAGFLFFSAGLDRYVIGVIAGSLAAVPPGSYVPSHAMAAQLTQMGSIMLTTGLRLAMPCVCVLLLIDFALALAGRVCAQLQLLSLAFPLKMLVALLLFGRALSMMPRFSISLGEIVQTTLRQIVAVR